jgi:hypothetical protein
MDVVNLHTLRTCIVWLMPKYSLYNLSQITLPVLKEYKSQAVKNNSITNVLHFCSLFQYKEYQSLYYTLFSS